MSLNLGAAEATGIECAKLYGLKTSHDELYEEQQEKLKNGNINEAEIMSSTDYERIKNDIIKQYNGALGKGFILGAIVLCFSVTVFVFCEQILFAIDIAEDNCIHTGYMVMYLIPGIILQTINFQLQVFVQAQGINWPIGVANILSIIICSLVSGPLMNSAGVGILIFPCCKMIMETLNLISVLVGLFL